MSGPGGTSIVPRGGCRADGWEIRVRGTVQGVGFRPTVWRLAERLGLRGEVRNDGEGVLIRVAAEESAAYRLLAALRAEPPPLATIDSAEVRPVAVGRAYPRFEIARSGSTAVTTPVTPDAYTCPACRREISDPRERRYRYPFTNCTHCGPRFSIVLGIPYDRAQTTMSPFALCEDCRAEYETPADRRFHAQPIACPRCGPRAWLVHADGEPVDRHDLSDLDDVDAAARLIGTGAIVAVRGLGGFHLACDASDVGAVERLRRRKRRDAKPFALMARDLVVIRKHCRVSPEEEALLVSSAAPIVLLDRRPGCPLPRAIAPGLATLGFLLPTTPLHHLILDRFDRPLVMTSGNLSSEPQVIANAEVGERLGKIADYALLNDREIANRIDDSVVRVAAGRPRLLRRARGYAPRPLALPAGFEEADGIVAFGGELKSTFCLVKRGQAILSPHQGDLEDARTYDEFVRNLELLTRLFEHRATHLAADLHPEYLSTKLARRRSAREGLPLIEIQHHHAHTVSCLAENGVPLASRPVLGISLDGLGYGDDGILWGGEMMLADYRTYRRVATFRPVAMLGGAQAIYEPWRSAYAHLVDALGWKRISADFAELDLVRFLASKPRSTLDRMLERGINSPLSSSCGRLFDAVAAAAGCCREAARFEGQAAMELEAAVDPGILGEPPPADGDERLYPFAVAELDAGLAAVDARPMWRRLLADLADGAPLPVIAARFHRGLARELGRLAGRLLAEPVARGEAAGVVALSGGCFQNRILLELVVGELERRDLRVLTQATVPANDGGLSLGQAAIAAARLLGPATGTGASS